MKHYKLILWTVIFILLGITACEKDPFTGIDNYLLNFSLQDAEGNVFDGEIVDQTVQLSIPSNVDVKKLTPKYLISELATVSPSPETITDWTMSQKLVVTSHNGTAREYVVTVINEDVVSGESVYLRTDEEVAAFASKKMNVVNGDVVIGALSGLDSISNIDALGGLKEVRYKLVVNPTYKGDLKALTNLQSVGSLIVNEEPKGLTEIVLPKLESIQTSLSSQSNLITNITLPALIRAGDISITSVGLSTLSMAELKQMGNFKARLPLLGNLDIKKVESMADFHLDGGANWSDPEGLEPTLQEILLSNLTACGMIEIESFPGVKSLDLSKLQTATKISLENFPALSALKLNELRNVEGILTETNKRSYNNNSFTQLDIPLLESVGEINLEAFEGLKTVKLPALKVADKFILIRSVENWETPKLEEINLLHAYNYVPSFFRGLKKVNSFRMEDSDYEGEIDLSHIQIEEDVLILNSSGVTAIHMQKTLNGSITLNYSSNSSATQLPRILGLEECRSFEVSNAPGIQTVVLPESLRKVADELLVSGGALSVSGANLVEVGTLNISANNIESMSFPNLVKVTNKLRLFGKFLETVYLPKVTSVGHLEVGGSWSGYQNEKLKNLNFLSSLTSIETLEIVFCKFLTDYSGLENAVKAGTLSSKNWNETTVRDNAYNPTFEDLKAGRYVKP